MRPGPKPLPLLERLLEGIELSPDGCWIWTRHKTRDGYAELKIRGTYKRAHRIAYQEIVGLIPDGLQIDHLCRVRHCINPEHMDCVTLRENVFRGDSGQWIAAKTHCPQGHPYDKNNTRIRWSADHWMRECRICAREHQRRYKERQRALAEWGRHDDS